jgi:hypothetical protein
VGPAYAGRLERSRRLIQALTGGFPLAHAFRLIDHLLMTAHQIWRSIVLFGLFVVLLIAGWSELPDGDSILRWYVIVASAAVPAFIARFWW